MRYRVRATPSPWTAPACWTSSVPTDSSSEEGGQFGSEPVLLEWEFGESLSGPHSFLLYRMALATESINTESLNPIHGLVVGLVVITDVIQLYAGVLKGRIPLLLAGVGFVAGVGIYLLGYRRRLLYLDSGERRGVRCTEALTILGLQESHDSKTGEIHA